LKNKNIVFMGTPDYAGMILKELLESCDIKVSAVFTQPDKPVGRKQVLTPPFVKKFLKDNGYDIPIYQPKTLKDDKVKEQIEKFNPDFIVVAAYGQILPRNILNIAPCINLHASILPKYRGASPIQSALLNDDKYSGVTAMLMEEGLDSGDMLGFVYVDIKQDMVVGELFDELSRAASKLTLDIIKEFDSIKPLKQFKALASYSKKITKKDGEVEFDNAYDIYMKYRAFTPWPGIYLKNGLKIKKMSLVESESSNNAGVILDIEGNALIIGCKTGKIKFLKVQPPSKKEMSAREYIVGKRLKVGDKIIEN
jgi:methionyl-tRNA formyltransferase